MPKAEQSLFAMASIVTDSGMAITVKHFTEDCARFVAISRHGSVHQAKLVRASDTDDLALISVSDPPLGREMDLPKIRPETPFAFWSFRPQKGKLPLVAAPVWGWLQTLPEAINQGESWQFIGRVERGHSGAGVIDEQGNLVAMITSVLIPRHLGGLALKVEKITDFLRQQKLRFSLKNPYPVALECVS